MKDGIWISAVLLTLAFGFASSTGSLNEGYPEVQKESGKKSVDFPDAQAPKQLDIDNVEGFIHVIGYAGRDVQLDYERTIRGRTREDLELARKEVQLLTATKANRIELYVDGPFRCQDRSVRSRRLGYRVRYDMDVRVPGDCELFLRTVNDGDLRVENVNGKYDLENVNGGIQLKEVAGSGRAHTVNGGIRALFARNPQADCSFSTLNGDVDVAFQPGISADFWFKTFNGSAYTDFNLMPLPQAAPEQERRNGKYVYRSNRFAGARAGRGGPQIMFDSLNGSIHVTSR
jgi:hypothetical protein